MADRHSHSSGQVMTTAPGSEGSRKMVAMKLSQGKTVQPLARKGKAAMMMQQAVRLFRTFS